MCRALIGWSGGTPLTISQDIIALPVSTGATGRSLWTTGFDRIDPLLPPEPESESVGRSVGRFVGDGVIKKDRHY
jgi:hypothetical protein